MEDTEKRDEMDMDKDMDNVKDGSTNDPIDNPTGPETNDENKEEKKKKWKLEIVVGIVVLVVLLALTGIKLFKTNQLIEEYDCLNADGSCDMITDDEEACGCGCGSGIVLSDEDIEYLKTQTNDFWDESVNDYLEQFNYASIEFVEMEIQVNVDENYDNTKTLKSYYGNIDFTNLTSIVADRTEEMNVDGADEVEIDFQDAFGFNYMECDTKLDIIKTVLSSNGIDVNINDSTLDEEDIALNTGETYTLNQISTTQRIQQENAKGSEITKSIFDVSVKRTDDNKAYPYKITGLTYSEDDDGTLYIETFFLCIDFFNE